MQGSTDVTVEREAEQSRIGGLNKLVALRRGREIKEEREQEFSYLLKRI